MPLYVYHCENCKQDFEKMVRFTEADKSQECPSCNSHDTRKRVTSFASSGYGSSSGGYSGGGGCSSSGGGFS